jgi:hypothetical protein
MSTRSLNPIAWSVVCVGFTAITFLGCGSERYADVSSKAPSSASANESEGDFGAIYSAENDFVAGQTGLAGRMDTTISPAKSGGTAGESKRSSASLNRKIIYKSQLRINVENFNGIDTKLNRLINQTGGFVANANVDHMQGRRRHGHWQIRVPVANYQSFMNSVGDIGAVTSRKEDANDVTAEFYDLEARIKNKQRLEERIAALLEQAKGELKRLIEVEKELARVREEIERMEGRKRYLSDVTALTTIDVYVTEVKNYVPAQAASFSDRIGNAWSSAVDQSTETAQDMTVGLVRNAINIVAFFLLATVAWLIYRIFIKGRRRTTTG